ncbi:MAG: iron-containing alcohol dehydrogenase [Flexilinea sp.]
MKYGMMMPRKYIQGDGVFHEISTYAALLGEKPLVVWGHHGREAVFKVVSEAFDAARMAWEEWLFGGESTLAEAKRVESYAREKGCDTLIGLGGGKVIDTAKGVAGWMGLPVLIGPTVAATDAPITSTTGWYNEDGIMTDIYVSKFNPDILLVDTGVIARAPLRMFIAGLGDGISTYIESSAAYASHSTITNRTGGLPTMATRAIARLCFDTLMNDGIEAVRQVKQHRVTPVVERVVEAMVFQSGLGGESGGIAVAHSIANNLPYFPENRKYYHGENVAFGVCVQLMIDDAITCSERQRIVDWMASVELPVTLDGIGSC